MIGLGLAFCAVAGAPAIAEVSLRACTQQDEAAADALYDHLNSWAQIKVMFDQFSQCDDGGVAEGNSEAIARLLVDHWNTLPELDRLSHRDHELRHWVLDHIDTTLDVDDLRKLDRYAKLNCPRRHSALCKDLRRTVAQAMKD